MNETSAVMAGGQPRRTIHEINQFYWFVEWMWLAGCRSWLRKKNEFGLPFFWWVMAGLPAMAPPKGRERNQTNSFNWSTNKQKERSHSIHSGERLSSLHFSLKEMKGRESGEWIGMTSGAPRRLQPPRQAHSATLLFVGPLCALKKEDNCWNGRSGNHSITFFNHQSNSASFKTKKV